MGGRVYDPLAGRFTTADPILQAPYSSQGQNRYAYVFNDPINMTDPSGFAWEDTGSTGGNIAWGIGAAAWGGTAAYAAGSAAGVSLPATLSGFLPSASAAGVAGGVGGGLANAIGTLLANPFGSSSGATYGVAAPSGAQNSNPVKPGGMNAVGQGSPPGPIPAPDRSNPFSRSGERLAGSPVGPPKLEEGLGEGVSGEGAPPAAAPASAPVAPTASSSLWTQFGGWMSRMFATSPSFGPDDLTLGLNSGGRLKAWAARYGGRTFGQFAVPRGSFDVQIRAAMNQAAKIRFNLDGIDLGRVNGALNEFGEPVGGYTNYELYLVKSNPAYYAKTTFYMNGAEICPAF